MAKMGRPKGTPDFKNIAELKTEIVEWISEGETLRSYCRQEGKPKYRTIYDWLEQDKDFSARFARARDVGHDAIAEDMRRIAQTEPLAVFDEAGNKRYDPGSIAHKKLMIETDMKLLSKWNPKKYGDRTTLAGDDTAPLVVEANFDVFGALLKNLSLQRQANEQ